MRKKALILASFCTIGLCTWGAQAITRETTPINNELTCLPHGYDEIILEGDLLFGIGPTAIEAGASDDAVYIQFNQSFGNVSVTIYNDNGLQIYCTIVDTSVQKVVIIPILGASGDLCTVALNNAKGSAEGDFERN